MTLQQILTKISLYYPHSYTNSEVVSILNDALSEIYKDASIKKEYAFKTVADQKLYTMPSNMEIGNIKYFGKTNDAVVTNNSYFQPYSYETDPYNNLNGGFKFYDGLDGNIGIYPIPTITDQNVKIMYDKKPATLSESTLSAVPDIITDAHLLLVYKAVMELAGAGHNPDTEIVNIYTIKYNDLYKQIKVLKYNSEPNYTVTKDVMNKRGNSSDRTEVIVLG
jgi:hypothetical protein